MSLVGRWILSSSVALSACAGAHRAASHDHAPHLPLSAPEHFLVGSKDGGPPEEPVADGTCKNPLVDPRGAGVTIKLVKSSGGYGDYEVPAGKYGVGAHELLRVECATGKAVGIVAP
jgi:hypothetical protein